ncbi:MAG: hypothetical protein IT436_14090 [Phycisphaerales bacterium]|nr:hypothetical protein [Phycisphaerales bacterium]
MDDFAPGTLIFISDLTRKPGSRVELGVDMHKFLAENPAALPTIAVQMICAVIDKVSIDQDEAQRLQWEVTEAMTEKLANFKRIAGVPDEPAAPKPTPTEFDRAAADFAAKFQPCLILTSALVGHEPSGKPKTTFACQRNVGENCPANDAVALTGAVGLGYEYHLQQVADELGVTTEKLRAAIAAAITDAKPRTRDA